MLRNDGCRGRLAAAASALAAIVVLLAVTPAAADETDLSYSLDGIHWSSAPPASVLEDGWVAVPGASRAGVLHLRVERPGATLVAVYASPARTDDRAVIEALRVTGTDGAEVAVDGTTACAALAPQAVLEQGETIRVPITVGLDAELSGGQRASVALDLLVAVSDTAAVPLSNGCPVDPAIVAVFPEEPPAKSPPRTEPQTGALPGTGASAPVLLVAAAAAALLSGSLAAFTRRRGAGRGAR